MGSTETKREGSCGEDVLTAEMTDREELVDLWWEPLNWCWRCGMVLSVWRSSVVVPVPKRSQSAVPLF